MGRIRALEDRNHHLEIQVKKLYRFMSNQFTKAPSWRSRHAEYIRWYAANKCDRESDIENDSESES